MAKYLHLVGAPLASLSLAAAHPAIAQIKPDADGASCPAGRTSIYYPSGEAAPSPEAQLLIARVSERAAACEPDGIDLVTRINPDVDGEKALSLALQRLGGVAEDLVARGVPSDRIRIAAQAGSVAAPPGLGEVEVIFRKSRDMASDVAVQPKAAPAPNVSPDLI